MSDTNEKAGYTSSDSGSDTIQQQVFERPTGIKGIWSHPYTQVSMLGFVCFMCPGLFNAINGLGGGGQLDATTAANANTAVYSTFAACAFFAGSIHNKLGSKLTLQLGTIGYCLYIGSFLSLNINPASHNFVIGAGAILGICAGLLWTAQGSMMMSYPTESQKGLFIGIFWSIFNLGGVVGASVAAGENWHSSAGKVSNGTYIGFIVMTGIGVALPMLMVDPTKMIRTDGTKVQAPRHPSWKIELKNLYTALRTDPMILLLFPMFFASNYFYTWQFDDFNGALFTIRARSLNNVIYWSCQALGSVAIGLLLDSKKLSRRVRAFSGWGVLFGMTFIVHIWAYFYQVDYTRESVLDPATKIDVYDSRYVGRLWLYIFCAFLDSMWQTASYWMMGAMSNDPAKLAFFSGFYKSLQSAGAAVAWRLDGLKKPYMDLFISTWVLLVAGLVFALPMIHLRVKNHTDLADETIARIDDSGNIKTTEEVAKELGTGKTATTA